MVLAAKSNNKVELIEPPINSIIGERITLENDLDINLYEPLTSTQIKKKKIWENIAINLKTNNDTNCIATWSDKVLITSAGPCKAMTLMNAPIS